MYFLLKFFPTLLFTTSYYFTTFLCMHYDYKWYYNPLISIMPKVYNLMRQSHTCMHTCAYIHTHTQHTRKAQKLKSTKIYENKGVTTDI